MLEINFATVLDVFVVDRKQSYLHLRAFYARKLHVWLLRFVWWQRKFWTEVMPCLSSPLSLCITWADFFFEFDEYRWINRPLKVSRIVIWRSREICPTAVWLWKHSKSVQVLCRTRLFTQHQRYVKIILIKMIYRNYVSLFKVLIKISTEVNHKCIVC